MKRIKTSRCENVREFYSAEYSEEDFKKEVEKEKIKLLNMETTFDNLIKIFKDYDYDQKWNMKVIIDKQMKLQNKL